MSEELIDKYVDRAAITADTEFLIAEIKRADAARQDFGTAKTKVQGSSSSKTVFEGADLGVKANAQLAESIKAITALINQRFASEAKLVTVQTDYAKATAANRLEIQKQNKELKDQAAYNAANTGSIEKARAAVALLNTERNKLNLYTKEGQEQQAKLNAQIDKYNAFIKKSVDNLSAQKINIGNYQGSAKIIVEALEKEKQKLEELEKTKIRVQGSAAAAPFAPRTQVTGFAGTGNLKEASGDLQQLNAQIEQSRIKIEGFSRITEQPKFLNIAGKVGDANQELKFFTKSLIDLERNGLGSSAAADELRKHLAELTDQISDAKAEVKALSSDTRGFDLFAGSVSFAADAFQLFAGAAVLAGASEEDAAEATKTLTAVQSVANGVKGIANELTTRGTAANKLYAFAQNQVKVAMDATATTGTRLKAVLATIGIGAIIIGIGLLITNFSKIKDALTGVTAASKAYNETLEDYKKGASEAIEKTNKVGLAFTQAKEGVISKKDALKIYNDTLGDTFGKANSLAEAEKLYNEKAGVYIQIMGLKAQANALFAKSAEAAAKGIVAANEDQVTLLDKFKLSLTREAFFSGISPEQIAKQQADNVRVIKERAEKDAKDLYDLGAKSATEAERLAKASKIDTTPEKAKEKKTDDTAIKDALEAEKKKNAAIKALAIENANEIIRINQAVVDADNTNLKAKLKSLDVISTQKKLIAGIEFSTAVESEAKIEKGKRVQIDKSNDEILLAKTKFSNQSKAIDDETAKNQIASQKAVSEKILAEYAKQREAKLKALDESVQEGRDRDEKEKNDRIIALNAQFSDGTLSQEKYNEARSKVDVAYHIASLNREIQYQKDLLKIIDLPEEKRAEALRALSNLEVELSDAAKDNHIKNEQDKLAATLKTLDSIQNTANTVFSFIDGLLNANEINQKNKLKEQTDAQEKKAARDIEIVNASTASEQDKAAKVLLINARLQAQKDQAAQRDKQIETERAKFSKAVAIFNIILSTTQAVIKAYTEGDPYTKVARAILAGVAGAAQLAVAIATPIPKYFKGKKKGEAYSGPAYVNDGPKNEVIERADGTIEFPQGKNVLTHVNPDDIVHPDKDAWLNEILNAATRDANAHFNFVPAKNTGESLSTVMEQHTKKIVTAIKEKQELHLGASEKGMVALWQWGSKQTGYVDQNTNW